MAGMKSILTDAERSQLRQLVDARGEHQIAKELDVHIGTLWKAIAGGEIRAGTIKLIRLGLEKGGV